MSAGFNCGEFAMIRSKATAGVQDKNHHVFGRAALLRRPNVRAFGFALGSAVVPTAAFGVPPNPLELGYFTRESLLL
jgi:hypothetical protein